MKLLIITIAWFLWFFTPLTVVEIISFYRNWKKRVLVNLHNLSTKQTWIYNDIKTSSLRNKIEQALHHFLKSNPSPPKICKNFWSKLYQQFQRFLRKLGEKSRVGWGILWVRHNVYCPTLEIPDFLGKNHSKRKYFYVPYLKWKSL